MKSQSPQIAQLEKLTRKIAAQDAAKEAAEAALAEGPIKFLVTLPGTRAAQRDGWELMMNAE